MTINLSTDTNEQRKRLLDALTRQPVTTLQAREEFDIMHPAARVLELRERGYNIQTLILPRTSGHSAKRVISLTEENYENQTRFNYTDCPQKIYSAIQGASLGMC